MNDKDNELDLILNQYASKTSSGKSASIDELDALLGDISAKKTKVFNTSDVEEVPESDEIPEATYDESDEDSDLTSTEFFGSKLVIPDESISDSRLLAVPEEEKTVLISKKEVISDLEQNDLTSLGEEEDEDENDKPVKASKPKKKKVKRKKSKVNSSIFTALIVVCVVLTVSFAIAIFGINMGMEYLGVGKKDVTITINIPKGSDSGDVTELLYKNGLIDNKTLFKVTLRIKNAGGSIKPGDITLKPSMGYDTIIENLCKMRESYEQVSITFPEGISLYEAAELLEENEVCSAEDFIYQFNSENFGYDYEEEISTSAEKFYKFEGLFFPDTYSFYVEDSAYNVARNMREQFEKVMQENDLYNKIEKSGLSLEDVIILASVVQAEAANEDDMKYVASVFINRLNSPSTFPRLESDATDNYYTNVIVPQNGDTTSLAMFRDAYDTYVRKGLPSGAIGNPGLDAILAVVEAPETNYFYFCSNLETRECFFAETLSEHEENLVKAGLV